MGHPGIPPCQGLYLECVVSEAIRNSLRHCNHFENSLGACPTDSLVCVRYCTVEFLPLWKNYFINPYVYCGMLLN
jgi:hypothetical protein